MSIKTPSSERAPWGDFPPVVRCAGLGTLKNDARYVDAKAGSVVAALAMVQDHLTEEFVAGIRRLAGNRSPVIVPVLAQESTGTNKIPLAMAVSVGEIMGLEVEDRIVQSVRAFRTDSNADHRLAFSPSFDGPVEPGQAYILMDDTLAMGGTLAALRAHIVNRGGLVLGACAMTAHEGALDMPVKQLMLDRITAKHGEQMNTYWIEEFGYGIDQLTQGEAGHLRAASSVDAIRSRITEARNAHGAHRHAESAAHAGGAGQGNSEKPITPDQAGRSLRETLGSGLEAVSSYEPDTKPAPKPPRPS